MPVSTSEALALMSAMRAWFSAETRRSRFPQSTVQRIITGTNATSTAASAGWIQNRIADAPTSRTRFIT